MMTFAMSYAYSEDYILVLSHDEVVHLKCSMINKMPGLGFDKYANLKAGYAFMMGHAGKKLLFMGQDFAQLREWSEERELDWYLLEEPEHQAIQSWMRDLLHMYKKRNRHFMNWISHGKDSSGSMQMMHTEAFTALSAILKMESITFCS